MNKVQIPLFIHMADPNATIIIDNNILVCMENGGCDHYPFRSFEFLRRIATELNGQGIPKELQHHLFNTSPINVEL